MLSITIPASMQLREPPTGHTELVDTSKMVSKRSARSFVEEENEHEEKEYRPPRPSSQGNGNALAAVCMQRSSSASSTGSDSSSSVSSASSHAEGTGVDIGMELTSLVSREVIPLLSHKAIELDAGMAPRPPINFGIVIPGVYRSSYPRVEDYGFLHNLKLKSIVTLVDKHFSESYRTFINDNGIKHYMFKMKGTKKQDITAETMRSILRIVLDRRNQPLLIHCNHGKHRTGCVVAVIRKMMGWDLPKILEEYRTYAGAKVRECDLQYITAFQLSSLKNLGLDLDLNLSSSSSSGGGMAAPAVMATENTTTTVGFRVPNFFRATFFTLTVLLVWMISGSKMAHASQRR